MIDLVLMQAELIRDENNVLKVYDDATGLLIKPGSHVIGHPTIGVGRSLDIDGITPVESRSMLLSNISAYVAELSVLSWYQALDPARQRAIVNMRHQLGRVGLLNFRMMIAALVDRDYEMAATAARNSIWRQQTPERADRVIALLQHGDNPPLPTLVG